MDMLTYSNDSTATGIGDLPECAAIWEYVRPVMERAVGNNGATAGIAQRECFATPVSERALNDAKEFR